MILGVIVVAGLQALDLLAWIRSSLEEWGPKGMKLFPNFGCHAEPW
ncbi:MAG: hypothetical protein IID33_06980 [Planctomycetes bacterium]|nr:hypothetical protein [Planctomycetota bacterium]